MSLTDRPLAEIDLRALQANWRRLAAEAPAAETAGVVKANGYGLGAGRVADALRRAGCRSFFVARAEEGLDLRAALGPSPRVYVLEGALREAKAMAEAGVVPVLNQPDDVAVWGAEAKRLGRRLDAALHVDTGMTRLGFAARDLAAIGQGGMAPINPLVLMSHLACAEEAGPMNDEQRGRLLAAARLFPDLPLSLANSAGVFLGTGFHFALCRPGIALYGSNPTPGRTNPMRPVLRLTAPVLQVHALDEAAAVGYGATFRARPGSIIATLGLGYADGFPRAASNRARARVEGVEVPVAGRVSMDLIGLDVTALGMDRVRPGTRAELVWGPDGVDRLAAAAGTIAYEVLTRLGPRIERRYVDDEAP